MEQLRDMATTSTAGMKDIIHGMIADVQQCIGEPLCGHTVVGCGSLAREEMTPYSDLEFFIFQKEKPGVKEYIHYPPPLCFGILSHSKAGCNYYPVLKYHRTRPVV